jgi:putative ABC transport system permease protein
MTEEGGARGVHHRVARLLVRVASWLVPRPRRAEWLREWRGELWARGAGDRPLVLPALGAFRHAFWLRRAQLSAAADTLARDVRHATRSLWRRPLFALSAVATLALGLGATTAVYSVVDAVLLAPLPYPGAERFVSVQADHSEWAVFGRQMPGLSAELFVEWKARSRSFETLEAYVTRDAALVGAGAPEIVREAMSSPGFLSELLGIETVIGRHFDVRESSGDGPAAVMISEALWRQRFDARRDVLGTMIRVGSVQREVIGVVPAVALLPDVSVWTPLQLRVDHSRRVLSTIRAVGRLTPGLAVAAAQDELTVVHERAAREHPTSMNSFAPAIVDYRSVLVDDVRTHLLLLLGAVAAVLLIACVNVTNLFLARGVERAHELAVRTSLGAGRGHLLSQVLAESVVLAAAGGAAGLAVAQLCLHGMLRFVPAEIPLATSIGLDARVLAFAALATIGTAAVVGVAPSLRLLRAPRLASGRRSSATRRQRRTGRLLLGVEVAQAAALLVAAGLMINTLARMTTAPPGFEPDGLAFAHLALPGYSFATEENPTRRAAFLEELRTRIAAVPGVRAVGVASATPFSGMTFMIGVEPEGGVREGMLDSGLNVPGDTNSIYFSRIHADPGYLEALGLPIVAGRTLGASDVEAAAGASATVGLVNETAARAYWPGEDPIGRRIRVPSFDRSLAASGATPSPEWITIVGVVADFGHPGLPTEGIAELYVPLSRDVLPTMPRPTVLIRHDGPADALLDRVRREIWTIDPELPIPAVATAAHELSASLAVPRFYTVVLGFFAALAIVLAAVGIYGVVASAVARRTHEIGIRMALGARARTVAAMIMREGLVVVGCGLAVGLGAGMAASRMLEGLLYGVRPTDRLTAVAVVTVLTVVAAAALWIPARRAMRADPVASLRAE